MDDKCLFCKIVAKEIPAKILYEDDDVLAFWDINPQAPVHFLVIPKKHITGPVGITTEDEALIGKVLRVGAELAKKNNAEHYRFIANNGEQAGQVVFHLHFHVLGGRPLSGLG